MAAMPANRRPRPSAIAGEVIAVVQSAMLAGLAYTGLRDAILTHPTQSQTSSIKSFTLARDLRLSRNLARASTTHRVIGRLGRPEHQTGISSGHRSVQIGPNYGNSGKALAALNLHLRSVNLRN